MKKLILKSARQFKIWLNYLLDRVMDLSLFLLSWSVKLPGWSRRVVQSAAYLTGDLAWLLGNFPRVDAFLLKGAEWQAIFTGSREGCLEFRHLLFKDQEVILDVLPRVWVWRLPRQQAAWLDAGIHLVVNEHSRLFPWKPTAAYSFTGPDWIGQIIDIPADPEDLLVGRRMRGPRRRIRHAEQNGFSFRHTRAKADFDYYYEHMYLPFVQTRHGEKALTSPYQDIYTRWFKFGGLLLVTRNHQPVAGSLVLFAGDVSQGIEMGILHNDPQLIYEGINAIMVWSTILWSHQQGARRLDLGASHAWCENGSFDFKALWGARVARRGKITPDWTFSCSQPPESLRQRLNQIGKICRVDGKYYRAYLPGLDESNLEENIQEALQHGLAGIAVVKPGAVQVVTSPPAQEA
jgi:hypothetical protein